MATRELSATALMRACLDRVGEREAEVHAFVHLDPDAALAHARALDAGPWRGPPHGLPLGVKDLFDTADIPTGYGSPIYAGHRPVADAAAVTLCRDAGALLPGKTVSTEFAYFHPGPTRNPCDLGHTPGGSSSGSAAAVTDKMLPLAVATQTAASIIRPAAYCGIVGYKPTWGRVSRAGVKSLSETLDTVGALGRCVRDVALLGSVLTGDRRLLQATDATSLAAAAPRIGLCRTPDWAQVDADVKAAWNEAVRALAPQSSCLVDAPWPSAMPDLVTLQKQVMAHEMARALGHERVHHRARISEHLNALFDEGIQIDGERHVAHLAQTTAARALADYWFNDVDLLLTPSTTGEAPEGIGATGDPLFCRGWTLLGLPCVHLPFARGCHGLPVGLQVVGRAGDDHRLLAAAQWCWERLSA